MNLYEINNEIYSLIDEETGEIADLDIFEKLNMQRDEKIESIGLWIKNLLSDAEAIKAEETKLTARRRAAENKANGLKQYLSNILCGQKFQTPRLQCTYRKSTSVQTDDGFVGWAKDNAPEYLKIKEPEANKTAIKEAIQNGTAFEFARLVESNNLQVK